MTNSILTLSKGTGQENSHCTVPHLSGIHTKNLLKHVNRYYRLRSTVYVRLMGCLTLRALSLVVEIALLESGSGIDCAKQQRVWTPGLNSRAR